MEGSPDAAAECGPLVRAALSETSFGASTPRAVRVWDEADAGAIPAPTEERLVAVTAPGRVDFGDALPVR